MKTFNERKSDEIHREVMGMIRSDVKVLDCTIRDGGAVNNSHFDDRTVRAVYDACADAGIDYMEIGYKNDEKFFDPQKFGKWRFCREDDIRRIVGDNKRDIKLAAMLDAGKSNPRTALVGKSESPVDLIRVATYAKTLPEALDTVAYAADLGYETSVNIMAVSTLSERELNRVFESAAESRADIVYMMDSFGGLDPHRLRYVLAKCRYICVESGKRIGMHIHDNLQLAFANTIEAVVGGADIVDCTLAGMGRGAGNCRTELLAGFLQNPRFRIRPILECVQDCIEPLRKKYSWGVDYAFMATGLANVHPSAAIAYGKSSKKPPLADFFEDVENAQS